MTGTIGIWVWVAVIAVCTGAYYAYRRWGILWLSGKRVKLPKMFEPKAETRIERLKAQTEKEVAKAGELKSVLEAKTELAKARAENNRLMKQIEGVSEKSVEQEKRDVEMAEKKAREAKEVKPRRL